MFSGIKVVLHQPLPSAAAPQCAPIVEALRKGGRGSALLRELGGPWAQLPLACLRGGTTLLFIANMSWVMEPPEKVLA